jgi:SAM-dependent methyltransferase
MRRSAPVGRCRIGGNLVAEPFTPPPEDGLDWRTWVARWDRMQERYAPDRPARFSRIAGLVRAALPDAPAILDVGSGTGALSLALLEALPGARVVGVDLDPSVMTLAAHACARHGERFAQFTADLRVPRWEHRLPAPFDAIVSATSLHWLGATELQTLYRACAQLLRPGGLFLNADHVGSECPAIQAHWLRERDEPRAREAPPGADDWDGFWEALLAALPPDLRDAHERVASAWEGGVEQGMPLAWHLDALRAAGFEHVDCFGRSACDAIYGGVRTGPGHAE